MKTLNNAMSVKGLNDIETLVTMHSEFFQKHTYDWWRKVEPGDVVMDIGSAVGMFTCHALDRGASKVYCIEPNMELLETTVINALPHMLNSKINPLSPIHCFIGSDERFTENAFGQVDVSNTPIMTFREIITKYEIKHLDYLKIDCEGGEYNVFLEENYDFLNNNVKHIAMEVHLDVFPEAPDLFIKMREDFIKKYDGKVRFIKPEHKEQTWDNKFIKQSWPIGWGGSWMIYLTKD